MANEERKLVLQDAIARLEETNKVAPKSADRDDEVAGRKQKLKKLREELKGLK